MSIRPEDKIIRIGIEALCTLLYLIVGGGVEYNTPGGKLSRFLKMWESFF